MTLEEWTNEAKIAITVIKWNSKQFQEWVKPLKMKIIIHLTSHHHHIVYIASRIIYDNLVPSYDYSYVADYFSRWDFGSIYQIRAMRRSIQTTWDCQRNTCSSSSEHLALSSHSLDVVDHFSSRDVVWSLWVFESLGHRVNWYFASIKRIYLFQYFSLIILLFLSEFIVGALVFVFQSGIGRAITMDIKDGIVKHYNATDRGGNWEFLGIIIQFIFPTCTHLGMISPSVSSIWDRVQTELQCCGVNSYEDWYFIESWPTEKHVPKSCCRTRSSVSTDTIYEGSGSSRYNEGDCTR